MGTLLKIPILILLLGVCYSAIPKKDRVIDQKLSDEDPGTPDYDADAFLGHEEHEEAKKLTPAEQKERLGKMFHKIDKDGDGYVSESELKDWITFQQQQYINKEVESQFPQHDITKDGIITWEEYKKVTYGHLDDDDIAAGDQEGFRYSDMMKRDLDRWEAAAAHEPDPGSNVKSCDKKEFTKFLHPEEFRDMHNVVLMETMHDIDENKDGYISMDEYIKDMYKPEQDGETEPDWVETERQQFIQYRDKDKDGKLSLEEMKDWILPDDYDHAEAEAKHLIYEADEDKDGEISKDEMLEKEDLFMGSQATNFGYALHGEL